MYLCDELFQRSREGYFGVYFPSCEATGEINTKITLEWMQRVRHESTYIILFLTQHNDDNNEDKGRSSHIDSVPLSPGLRSADDIPIGCWWRHNNQTIVTRSRE